MEKWLIRLVHAIKTQGFAWLKHVDDNQTGQSPSYTAGLNTTVMACLVIWSSPALSVNSSDGDQ